METPSSSTIRTTTSRRLAAVLRQLVPTARVGAAAGAVPSAAVPVPVPAAAEPAAPWRATYTVTPKFATQDAAGARRYLEEHGYVIIRTPQAIRCHPVVHGMFVIMDDRERARAGRVRHRAGQGLVISGGPGRRYRPPRARELGHRRRQPGVY